MTHEKYFGRDAQGYYAEDESGRQYMDEALWRALVAAGAHAGADTTGADAVGGHRVKLRIIEQVRLDKYAGDVCVESLLGTPDSSLLI